MNGKPMRVGTRARLRIGECDTRPTHRKPDEWPPAHKNRSGIGAGAHTGEVIYMAKSFVYVKPAEPVPAEVQAPLAACNTRISASNIDRGLPSNRVFILVADIVDDNLVLEVGMKVSFKFYQDPHDVGGYELRPFPACDEEPEIHIHSDLEDGTDVNSADPLKQYLMSQW